MVSPIWENETEERQDYIVEWIRESINIVKSDTKKTIKEKINKLLSKAIEEQKDLKLRLTEKQRDLLNYYLGEMKKDSFIKDILNISKEQIKEEIKQEFLDKEIKKIIKKVKDREYSLILNEEKKEYYTYTYIKGKKVLSRTEQYLKDGNINIRFRDKKGRFAGFVKK